MALHKEGPRKRLVVFDCILGGGSGFQNEGPCKVGLVQERLVALQKEGPRKRLVVFDCILGGGSGSS